MEHESYEDTTVARIMNEHFVSVKVDREERPDIDHLYMNAAYLIAGNGGWPLNVLALLDGRPFYAHIGGGFSRYSTDENWHVPHFEKMLYDNAQLVSLYTHEWQVTKNLSIRELYMKHSSLLRMR